ncbi:NAD-dependent epimerase/dehydratase family protein [Sphingobium sp. AP49]|uniref:NAD-dependent epimerase/dehydratase family protein n=1 Tax=Sphingobium sp. AP49 TaxID=1144307 RepID=UPI00026EE1D2|nr:NAD-dependent epimerase/dehydratase family protein [Sphingobium sp. AP49]WHO39982.1 NAD-dependent epimerase/dehydratase family protein [Sphingobium sp. AP49]
MSRFLITGAGGFAGHYFVRALRAQGHEVHGLIKPGTPCPADAAFTPHIGDLTDLPALNQVVANVVPDKVLHLAAISFVGHGDVQEIYDSNLIGSRNLLQALADHAPDVDRVLLMSSANIYGAGAQGAIDESFPPVPVNDYAISKLAMEQLPQLFADRLRCTIVRPFNYSGVGQAQRFLIPKIVEHVRARAPVIELGNLDVARDFSDVRFIVAVCLALFDNPAAIGEKVNICAGRAYSLRQIVGMASQIAGHPMRMTVNPSFVRTNEIPTLWGDRRKMDRLAGALPCPPLEDTLRWMIEA